jgi:hypothetical protein
MQCSVCSAVCKCSGVVKVHFFLIFSLISTTGSCIIDVTCGISDNTFKIKEDKLKKGFFIANMEHPIACIGSPTPPDEGLSGGWIFIIIVLVTTLVYIATGCLYKTKKLGTSGKNEYI